ncbi:MAG: DUF2019 domain-containing protein [Nitrospira sp.]|nr:DUF2019 domain-containing protein [Nitrospira sp.]
MKDLERLAKEFADNVVLQTDSIRAGNARRANVHARRSIKAFEALRERGDVGRDALLPLLSHARADIRGTAAAFLLRHRNEEAIAVLKELARGEGMDAFGAQQTLARWSEGTWSLDPAD